MRVLVLRPEPAASATAARLRQLGHEPVLSPVLTIEPADEPCPAGSFAAVLVTSRNAVAAICTHMARLQGAPFYVVGEETAAILRGAGFAVRATASDAVHLATAVMAHLAPGRVLHPGGRERKAEPAETLRRHRFDVVGWTVYRADPATQLLPSAREALAQRRLAAVLHYSARSARLAIELVEKEGLIEAFKNLPQICLSPDVAREVASLAARPRIAASPDEKSLLRLIG